MRKFRVKLTEWKIRVIRCRTHKIQWDAVALAIVLAFILFLIIENVILPS